MSITSGYSQFLRKYRLLIVHRSAGTKTSAKTVQTVPAVASTASSTTWTGTIKVSGSVNVRSGPGTSYKSLGTLKNGTAVEVLSKSGTWFQVKSSKGENGIAYIKGTYIKITGTKESTVSETVTETVTETEETDGNTLDLTGLRCTFTCEKSTTSTPNYSQITVYNLSQESIASIVAGDRVILEAGYENGNYGMIFSGEIIQPMVSRESSTDIALTLIVQDGDAYLNSAFTAQTIAKSSTQADIVNACLSGRTDVSAGLITSELNSSRLARGKVLFGKSSKYLSKVANGSASQLYIEDGKVNIIAASDYASDQAVELNPATGLIGTPEQTDDGVSAQCLINPSIKLNTLVYINSRLVSQKQVAEGETGYTAVNADGVYRVVGLTVEGDTHGDSWYMTLTAITQSGTRPTGLTSEKSNPWR